MNYYRPPTDGDRQQFNIPGFLNDLFQGGQSGFPGVGPSGSPGFPGSGQFPGGGNQGGFPGPPNFPGGGQPGFPGGGQSVEPTSPPPSFTPQKPQYQLFAVDPGAIRSCLFRFTYVWLDRDSFWFFPVFVGRNSIAGYRWRGFRWVYFGIDLDRIESFQCY